VNEKKGILRIIGDIRPEERTPVFLMLANITVILVAYYIIKVVREPLILSSEGGAAWKSYSAAAQTVLLIGYVPLYGWFSSKVNGLYLVLGMNLFFLLNIELFLVAVNSQVPYIGIVFFIWVGIFSLSVIAQFWSLANDIYSEEQGKRLFPIIAIGATLGSLVGSKLASVLFDSGLAPTKILQISASLLVLSMVLYWLTQRRRRADAGGPSEHSEEKLSSTSGFTLLFRSRYLLLIAALLLVLNVVNTTGEFILGAKVVEAAKAATAIDPSIQMDAFIGSFYGGYFFVVNILALILQTFFVSRIVKYFGIKGALLTLPLIALGAYTTIAAGAGFALIRWLKTAENATDYSVMNTARAMLWLPTSREEKYKAKQAVDTFIVRIGDLLSGAVVFVGLTWFQLGADGFALVCIAATVLWIGIALILLKEYRKRASIEETKAVENDAIIPAAAVAVQE